MGHVQLTVAASLGAVTKRLFRQTKAGPHLAVWLWLAVAAFAVHLGVASAPVAAAARIADSSKSDVRTPEDNPALPRAHAERRNRATQSFAPAHRVFQLFAGAFGLLPARADLAFAALHVTGDWLGVALHAPLTATAFQARAPPRDSTTRT